ncbi:AAA domain-containing protein [Bacillus benzoevorans]|uniref:Very-short-patch-repair endonuclease/organic radical activating enzyme n=1 Tax=Bacillus benzoevorans TaxID=1456 RepID=A0A7X0HRY7_9BACI|nr:AAA domain-containing protein [Bacillus benzoevorans]MBB6444486.1 very-short-patch-repair endonuclease/organic radical activating enzyme [Bacillus benzoevorans]
MNSSPIDRERTARLFTYLKELSLLKVPLTQDIQNYEDYIFLNEIPNAPECTSPLTSNVNDTWIQIRKPVKPPFPAVPKQMKDWLSPSFQVENMKTEPVLLEKIPNPNYDEHAEKSETNPPHLRLTDFPQIQHTLDDYKTGKWNPWKEKYLHFESIQKVYTHFFSIYQKQKKLGEQYELLVGIGLFNWKTPDQQSIHRHILTIPCSFQFDANNGIIRVVPSADGSKAELEQDMLELEMRLDYQALVPILEMMDELQPNFWNKELTDSICRSFAHSLAATGTYKEEELNHKREAAVKPEVLYSPALILRKRNEKGFQRACTAIIEHSKESDFQVPLGIKRIFEELDDYHQPDEVSAGSDTHQEDSTVFFPLEANEEQKRIIENIKTRNGVLVQGPPGTGKSHTIANLISHLLASGKRILITSETARALNVLKDKIPHELQNLCVSLLGADTKSFKDLETVVQYISNTKDTWQPEEIMDEMNRLSLKLEQMKKNKDAAQKQLVALREKETFHHRLLGGKYSGTAQSIAKIIHEQREKYHWLQDFIEMDTKIPLTNDEGLELIELLHFLNGEVQLETNGSIPPIDLLWNEAVFKERCEQEAALQNEVLKYEHSNAEIKMQLSILPSEKRERLLHLLDDLSKALHEMGNNQDEWHQSALQDVLDNKFKFWEELNQQIMHSVEMIQETVTKHNLSKITGYGQVVLPQLYEDTVQLHAHLKENKGLGMPLMRPKAVKDAWYIVKDVRFNGRKCDAIETLSLLEDVLHTEMIIGHIRQMIQEQLNVEFPLVQSRSLNLAKIKDFLSPFQALLRIKTIVDETRKEFFDTPVIFEKALDEQHINDLLHALQSLSFSNKLEEIQAQFLELEEKLEQSVYGTDKHSLVIQITEAIKTRKIGSYTESKVRLSKLDEYRSKRNRAVELQKRLKTSLPIMHDELMNSFKDPKWLDRYNKLDQAIDWAKVNTWLIQFLRTDETVLSGQIKELDRQMKEIITELGAHKAWYSTLSNMTEIQRQHLLAWTTSMKKVGKGTGKNVLTHLKDAQKHMSQCRDAIPAWIMPLYRVFDTFDVQPNLFDVVIIDEASQSGPDAVILQYIAQKLIVVGDDKQISPEYIGIKQEDVQYLRRQYLYDFNLADMLDIESSFFDLSNVLFGGRITLREHFRCMPEIIEFSNRISYANTPLVPLRNYSPNRLEPIRTIHISNGVRTGTGSKVVNRPEAEAVVAQIKACVDNPLYEGKSMGVISLQAEGQAQLIERLLVDAIGTTEFEKRNIICGDAYAFQGDERDVMFISMVAAPGNTAMRALTTKKDKRRFNVAVSRAKDQLWLFHTPTVNDFKNKADLRYELLSYCENPAKEILLSDRTRCVNDFECSVFDQIEAKGYKVIPQHNIAGFRIDLVVEGENGRLAVECEGDQWDGRTRYEHDRNRQQILEQSGWKFWRVRGSEYYYNPEQALSSLWQTLDEVGIEQNKGTVLLFP